MRPLAAVFVVLACLLAAPAAWAGKARPDTRPTAMPAVAAEDFPALRPIAPADPADGGVDERVLIPALYWLAIGGLVLRRRLTRQAEEAGPPVAGWVLAYGPPLPR